MKIFNVSIFLILASLSCAQGIIVENDSMTTIYDANGHRDSKMNPVPVTLDVESFVVSIQATNNLDYPIYTFSNDKYKKYDNPEDISSMYIEKIKLRDNISISNLRITELPRQHILKWDVEGYPEAMFVHHSVDGHNFNKVAVNKTRVRYLPSKGINYYKVSIYYKDIFIESDVIKQYLYDEPYYYSNNDLMIFNSIGQMVEYIEAPGMYIIVDDLITYKIINL